MIELSGGDRFARSSKERKAKNIHKDRFARSSKERKAKNIHKAGNIETYWE
jgi:hypothetical protein